MLGLTQRTFCRQKFKTLQILTVPKLYISGNGDICH